MCTVPLPPGVNPIAVNKYIYINTNKSFFCYLMFSRVAYIILPSSNFKNSVCDPVSNFVPDRETQFCDWDVFGILGCVFLLFQ